MFNHLMGKNANANARTPTQYQSGRYIVGGVLLLAIIILLVFISRNRRRMRKRKKNCRRRGSKSIEIPDLTEEAGIRSDY